MLLGLIGAIVCWFVSKSIVAAIFAFYLLTGIRKSSLWLGIEKGSRNAVLPPMIRQATIGSFIIGALLWPVVIIGCQGDPLRHYFERLKHSGMTPSETYKYLKRQDEIDK
jgi:hypothetical protein